MILYRLPILIFITGIVYIFISPSEPLTFHIFFKVIPMVLILIYAFEQSLPRKKAIHYWIIAGIVFSLIGDATLHWFLIGLSSFFLGHVCYTIGFVKQWRFSRRRILSVIPLILFASWIGCQLVHHLQKDNESHLIIPVIAYIIMLLIMALAAIMTGNRWAALGSILFVVSDSILAWNMFISSLSHADNFVMLTYYTAQFLIAHSLFTLDPSNKNITW